MDVAFELCVCTVCSTQVDCKGLVDGTGSGHVRVREIVAGVLLQVGVRRRQGVIDRPSESARRRYGNRCGA